MAMRLLVLLVLGIVVAASVGCGSSPTTGDSRPLQGNRIPPSAVPPSTPSR